ncbi:MAG: nucleotidyl transferase AbiEii/AbiGii toxin family protein [Ilumatobacteraceae bacterium]|jgi:hypothetical protein
MNLVERIVVISESLDRSGIDWALGGALALAYATEEPRATRDIDVNVFVPSSEVDRVFEAMPAGVAHGPADRRAVMATDQVRLWWDDTPIDLFFAADPFHLDAATRCSEVEFSTRLVRVLCPEDLAVFKAMFDRPKDWVDIAEMAASRALDRAVAAERLRLLLGDDPRVARLAKGD